MKADTGIKLATIGTVAIVASITAVVSYSHIRTVALAHGQTVLDADLLPISVDGLIACSSLVLLFASRHSEVRVPWLGRGMLILSVSATIAVNAIFGMRGGPLGVVLSAWVGLAFMGAAELLIWLIRAVASLSSGKPDLWSTPKETENMLIRSWAADQGMLVKRRGRVPRNVSRQYHAAMAGQNGNGSHE